MSVAQQAIAARRRSRVDLRYAGQARKDTIKRATKMKQQIYEEQLRKSRKGSKK